VINTASAGDINTISVGLSPDALALSPDGTTLYVANSQDNTITVINTSTDAVIATIPVGNSPDVVLVSPDGSTIYVANKTSGTISVISAASNAVTAAIQGLANPSGLYFGLGNSELFVTNQSANTVSIINLSTNAVSSTIPTASQPFGVLYLNNGDCPGVPVKFTITVNPAPANTRGITVSPATGTITACQGMASASPNIQQFTVSGNGLTSGISVAAPPNFEISLSPNSGYTTSISLTETDGGVSSTTIYVRIAATAPVNGVLGNVSLTTDGFGAKQVPVAGTVTAAPTVTNPGNQTVADGASTGAINFSTSGSSVTWSNDTPAIGLPATGSGNIAPFTASNTGSAPVTATITATPVSVGAGCPGVPVNFTITVNPSTGPPLITVAGSLTPLTTVYGTPSAPANFTVLGVSLSAGIVVTAPAGFEVSLDNSNFSPIVTVGSSGAISATTVYIRLASSTPVGNYGGNIIFTSAGAPEATLAMPQSTVTPALLTVIADDKTKHYGTPNPELTASYIGFVNFDTALQLVTPPVLATVAVTNSPIGVYPITVSGASSPNYNITFLAGTLTIVPAGNALVIPNTFTPNGDGVNDTWQIQYLSLFTNCSVDIFTRWGQKIYSSVGYSIPWDGTYRGAALPVGTYYYIINLKNGSGPLSGFVAIIK
jgi:gliding motility-associated-like protein